MYCTMHIYRSSTMTKTYEWQMATVPAPPPPFETSVLTGMGTVYFRGLRPMYLAGCFKLKKREKKKSTACKNC